MPLYKTFGVDLGTSMIKIYSAQNDSILKEKNMIAIRNENQILASGNEAYKIYEKNPSNVSVIEPMAFGKNELSFFIRISFRGPSRQSGRPDFRRSC